MFCPAFGSIIAFHTRPRDKLHVRIIRGSRPFKEICGHTRAERNSAGSLGRDPKRLPSSRAANSKLITDLLITDYCRPRKPIPA
jgi:hypothetical protein